MVGAAELRVVVTFTTVEVRLMGEGDDASFCGSTGNGGNSPVVLVFFILESRLRVGAGDFVFTHEVFLVLVVGAGTWRRQVPVEVITVLETVSEMQN